MIPALKRGDKALSVLGIRVCREAFCTVTHVSHFLLGEAIDMNRRGTLAPLAANELPPVLRRPVAWFDVRSWLEKYAEDHGDWCPNREGCALPGGRKRFYYNLYAVQRTEQRGCTPASYMYFLLTWRTDLPWLTICDAIGSFKKCGICTFIRQQIDSVPRNRGLLLDALKVRLARHFEFQGAQRIRLARIEEVCRQSQGVRWCMLVDRMDQNKTNLPSIAALERSDLFKEGNRLVVSLIGSAWSGVNCFDHYIRTDFCDSEHGSEKQASCVLLNLHAAITREHHIPEEFVVNADNTPKETKNQVMMHFAIWLLCVFAGTPLYSLLFCFLLVGHTHNRLDRFFGMLARCLRGHDYSTLDEMLDIASQSVRVNDLKWGHQTHVWNWKALGADMPKIHGLHSVHAVNVYRAGGIWVKWKMFMTDSQWSRPVLAVPAHRVDAVATQRPDRIAQVFKDADRVATEAWLNKLDVALSGSDACRVDLDWLRRVVRGQEPSVQDARPLEFFVADMLRFAPSAGGADAVAAAPSEDPALPDDVLVSLFPGGDHAQLPQDCLLKIDNIWEPSLPDGFLAPGVYVLARNKDGAAVGGRALPFLMGRQLPDREGGDDVLVQWFLPPLSPEVAFKKGIIPPN